MPSLRSTRRNWQTLYKPSYISLEYVLQQAGVISRFDSRITSVCYLSREVSAGGKTFSYRRIKEQIIIDLAGITRRENVNVATPERAFLDILYLNKEFYFDNLNLLDRVQIEKIAPIYRSAALEKRVSRLLKNVY